MLKIFLQGYQYEDGPWFGHKESDKHNKNFLYLKWQERCMFSDEEQGAQTWFRNNTICVGDLLLHAEDRFIMQLNPRVILYIGGFAIGGWGRFFNYVAAIWRSLVPAPFLIGTYRSFPRFFRNPAFFGRPQIHSGSSRFWKADRNGLFGGPRAVPSFADRFDLFLYKCSGLGWWRLSLFCCHPCLFDGTF